MSIRLFKNQPNQFLHVFVFIVISISKCMFCNGNSVPIALHQLHEMKVNNDIVISLHGVDLDGDETIATITSLPTMGNIYQLTYVFDKHGYDPKAGEEILNVPTNVTGQKSRIIYKRSYYNGKHHKDWFQYYVSDSNSISEEGRITIVPSSHILVGSDFIFSTNGWNIIGNKYNQVTHDPSSRGEMNHFIYASDDSINVDFDKNDIDIWRFNASQEFMGWHGILYGGTFEFILSSFSGDFTSSNANFDGNMNLIIMSCATCKRGKGITLAYPLLENFNGSTHKFVISMTESSGWLQDPFNTLFPWTIPSKCDFIRVLSGISSISILGDFTKWYESVSIDNIYWRTPKPIGRLQLPICAQQTFDARICTCS